MSVFDGRLHLRMISQNKVQNQSFETGTLSGWSSWGSGSKTVSTAAKLRDTYGVTVSGDGAVEQTVTGLTPNTQYKLSGWARVTQAGGQPFLGVKGYGGVEAYDSTTSSNWTLLQLEFTTGSANTSAVVYLYNPTGAGSIQGDEISVVPKVLSTSSTCAPGRTDAAAQPRWSHPYPAASRSSRSRTSRSTIASSVVPRASP